MQVTYIRKWQPREYETESMSVTVGHEELGLPAPTNTQEAYEVAQQLQYHARALGAIMEVRAGLYPADKINEKLAPWLPASMKATSVN